MENEIPLQEYDSRFQECCGDISKEEGKECMSKGCHERALYSMNVNEKSCCTYETEKKKSFLNSIFGTSSNKGTESRCVIVKSEESCSEGSKHLEDSRALQCCDLNEDVGTDKPCRQLDCGEEVGHNAVSLIELVRAPRPKIESSTFKTPCEACRAYSGTCDLNCPTGCKCCVNPCEPPGCSRLSSCASCEDGFTHLVTGTLSSTNTPIGTCVPQDRSIVRSISCLTTASTSGSEMFDFVYIRVAECLPSVFENALPFECHEEIFDEQTTTTLPPVNTTLPPRVTTTTEEATTTTTSIVPSITFEPTPTTTEATSTTTEEEMFLPIIPLQTPIIPYEIIEETTESTTTEEEMFLPVIPIRPIIPYDIIDEDTTTESTTTESIVCSDKAYTFHLSLN